MSPERPSLFFAAAQTITIDVSHSTNHFVPTRFMAHAEIPVAPTVVAHTNGTTEPDGPIFRSKRNGGKDTVYDLPASLVVVIRGKVAVP